MFLRKGLLKMQHIYRTTPMPKGDFNKVAFHRCSLCMGVLMGVHFDMGVLL